MIARDESSAPWASTWATNTGTTWDYNFDLVALRQAAAETGASGKLHLHYYREIVPPSDRRGHASAVVSIAKKRAEWRNHVRLREVVWGVEPDIGRQNLIVLSPFYLDATEVTVAAFRASGLATEGPIQSWDGSSVPKKLSQDCVYTPTPDVFDDHPVNCLAQELARQYCQLRGGDLPSEAQLEYALGGTRSALYLWGEDEPRCEDAGFGRKGLTDAFAACPSDSFYSQPVSRPDHGRDVLVLPTGSIFDLAGNVGEHAVDAYDPPGGSCWTTPILFDPI